jgi:hypothetical protein
MKVDFSNSCFTMCLATLRALYDKRFETVNEDKLPEIPTLSLENAKDDQERQVMAEEFLKKQELFDRINAGIEAQRIRGPATEAVAGLIKKIADWKVPGLIKQVLRARIHARQFPAEVERTLAACLNAKSP